MTKDIIFDQDSALKKKTTTVFGEALRGRNNAILDDDPMTKASEISVSPTSVAQIAPIAVQPITLTPTRQQPLSCSSCWSCPASEKCMKTTNPIRAIVDPIAKTIQSGYKREDGKDHISLAVRFFFSSFLSFILTISTPLSST